MSSSVWLSCCVTITPWWTMKQQKPALYWQCLIWTSSSWLLSRGEFPRYLVEKSSGKARIKSLADLFHICSSLWKFQTGLRSFTSIITHLTPAGLTQAQLRLWSPELKSECVSVCVYLPSRLHTAPLCLHRPPQWSWSLEFAAALWTEARSPEPCCLQNRRFDFRLYQHKHLKCVSWC